ncbi:MAG: TRAP transporter large permease subunit [Spirochaetaceae bacterium]|jgi:tripartite ATP-independent transporter DctM subunit|nr:TRAP transporter large permease subunit [Spirochaetaceae bacterium]
MRSIAKKLTVLLCALISLLPLVFLLIQDGLHIAVYDADAIRANLLFIFGCISACITWDKNKHISLASLTDKLPQGLRTAVAMVREYAIAAVVVALFFAAFSQMFSAFSPGTTVLGIPLRAVFALLPAAYLVILVLQFLAASRRIPLVLGWLTGLIIASGPMAGVIYSLFGIFPEPLSVLFEKWCALSGAGTVPLILIFVFLAFLGVPLFVVLSAIGYIAFSQGGGYVEVLSLEFYTILIDKSISAIPLFTITGFVLSRGSAGRRLVDVFRALFGWFRGGTVVAAIVVATFFTTFTGVSGVTILALGSLLTIILTGSGYARDKAHSLIAASGAIGLLFPPSVAIIMYGTTNYFSVDVFDLFKGAVIPGCLLALGTIALGFFFDTAKVRPQFSPGTALEALKQSAFELLLPVFISLGFFSGFFDLAQSAAFSVLYAVVLEVFVRKDFSLKDLGACILESIPVSGGILMILASARGLSYFMLDANIPEILSEWVRTFVSSRIVFLLLLNALLIVVGCLMDIYSAILVVSPLIIPIAESFGIQPVHAGVIFLMNMQLGFLTPPVGMDLFIASYTFNIPVGKVIQGIIPYLIVQACVLLLITYVPWFSSVLL